MTLKEQLLETGYFIANEWLDDYIALIEANRNNKDNLTEKHHILQKAYFKLTSTKIIDAKSNLVKLSFADHVKAHWLLYKCTKNELKLSNEIAVRWMVNARVSYQLEKGLNEADYQLLQKMWLEIKNSELTEYFSQEAEDFIIKHYNVEGAAYCAKILGRSRKCITIKATKLGLRSPSSSWWTEEETNWLIANMHLTVKQQADYLHKSSGAVSGKRRQLGLQKPFNSYSWSDAEIEILKNNYEKLGRVGCSKLLNRTPGAIQSQASYLGLTQNRTLILCVELNKVFTSVKSAAETLNISHNLIWRCLKGKQKQTNGYHFIKL